MNGKRAVKFLGISAIILAVIFAIIYYFLMFKFVFADEPIGIHLLKSIKQGNIFTDYSFFKLFFIIAPWFYIILFLIGGIGLLFYKKWARIILIIASAINLIQIPIGTIIGIIFLIYLFKEEVVKVLK